jgi:hypothetical protein
MQLRAPAGPADACGVGGSWWVGGGGGGAAPVAHAVCRPCGLTPVRFAVCRNDNGNSQQMQQWRPASGGPHIPHATRRAGIDSPSTYYLLLLNNCGLRCDYALRALLRAAPPAPQRGEGRSPLYHVFRCPTQDPRPGGRGGTRQRTTRLAEAPLSYSVAMRVGRIPSGAD